MPEDNRFAGLGEAVDEDGASTGDEVTFEDETTEPAEDDDPAAFSFDETTKKTVYVRPDSVDELEDARALVDAKLRTEHDVRDLTGREFYDAVFRLAAADTDELIDAVLDARTESCGE
ncbi:hypothetical protein [Natrononativus amylolyticus]|uniref:hypothetical protein n=1 Tax=Natrononativus amylolyticus TaxID=2963434 RepID=UPI0020CDF49F|nr:hypothetical protein [Natrononativus amylolyticus]